MSEASHRHRTADEWQALIRCAPLSTIRRLSNEATRAIDDGLLAFFQRYVPEYRLGYSRTADCSYLANYCPRCGLIQGDFFLHSEPGGPFFPVEPSDATGLKMVQLPIDEGVARDAALHRGGIESILNEEERAISNRGLG